MIILYIDTAERKNKQIMIKKDEKEIDKLSGDINLVSELRNLLEKNKLSLSDIGEVNFNTGPGSFTGLKMGCTVSNVLKWAVLRKNLSELSYPEYGAEPNIQMRAT